MRLPIDQERLRALHRESSTATLAIDDIRERIRGVRKDHTKLKGVGDRMIRSGTASHATNVDFHACARELIRLCDEEQALRDRWSSTRRLWARARDHAKANGALPRDLNDAFSAARVGGVTL